MLTSIAAVLLHNAAVGSASDTQDFAGGVDRIRATPPWQTLRRYLDKCTATRGEGEKQPDRDARVEWRADGDTRRT